MARSTQIEDGTTRNIAEVTSSRELKVTGTFTSTPGGCVLVDNCSGTDLDIRIVAQDVAVTVAQATADNLKADANMQQGDADVGASNKLHVQSSSADDFKSDANLQIGNADVGASNAVPVTPGTGATFTVSVSNAPNVGSIAGPVTPGTGGANLGKADDTAHAAGDTGVFILAVRRDDDTAPVSADNDYSPVTVDDGGRLKTVVGGEVAVKNVAATSLSTVDQSAKTVGTALGTTHKLFLAGFERDDSLTNGYDTGSSSSAQTARLDSKGALWVRLAENKMDLSGSTDGRPIAIAATASAGTLLHTADSSATDFIYLTLSNTSAAEVKVTLEVGGTSAADKVVMRIPAEDTRVALIEQPLTNSLVLRAFAGTASVVNATGYVRRDA